MQSLGNPADAAWTLEQHMQAMLQAKSLQVPQRQPAGRESTPVLPEHQDSALVAYNSGQSSMRCQCG